MKVKQIPASKVVKKGLGKSGTPSPNNKTIRMGILKLPEEDEIFDSSELGGGVLGVLELTP